MKNYIIIAFLVPIFTGILFADQKQELMDAIKKRDINQLARILLKADLMQKSDLEDAQQYAFDRLKHPSVERTPFEWCQVIGGPTVGFWSLYWILTKMGRSNGPLVWLHLGALVVSPFVMLNGFLAPIIRSTASEVIAEYVSKAADIVREHPEKGKQRLLLEKLIFEGTTFIRGTP